MKLKKAGVDQIGIDILVLRYFYEMNLRDIADEINCVSRQAVLDILNKTLKYLKDVGFGK